MFSHGQRIGIGISGGPDSVCLAVLIKKYKDAFGIEPVVVHVNHHLRGEESDRDEQFVREFAESSPGFKFIKYDIRITQKELKGHSVEELARGKRYGCFEDSIKLLHLDKIALAHTMNDNAETVFINMLRGTGITGISGIPPVRGHFVRPILMLSKDDVLEYLRKKGIAYTIDSTNESPDFLRNRIRHEVLPLMIGLNSRFLEHVMHTAGDLREIDSFMDKLTADAYNNATVSKSRDSITLNLQNLLTYPHVIVKRVLQTAVKFMQGTYYNPKRKHIDQIMDIILSGHTDSAVLESLSEGIKVYIEKSTIVFTKTMDKFTNTGVHRLSIPGKTLIDELGITFKASIESSNIDPGRMDENRIVLDYDKINDVLFIRTLIKGDRISLPGNKGHKKVHDLFIDKKVPRLKRTKIPFIVTSSGEIIAITGLFVDSRYRQDKDTKTFLKVLII